MTAPTTAVRFVYARAAVRATGALHVCSQRDSGLLMPVCGANHIRSARIDQHDTLPADVPLCADCAAIGATRLLDVATSGPNLHTSTVRVNDVHTSAAHPRSVMDIGPLTESIRTHGVLQPILVRTTDTGYAVVAGARRLHAARAVGLTTIPAIVHDVDAAAAVVTALVENLHRSDLNPIEQATAYAGLLEQGLTQAQIADQVGVSRPQVANTLRLLQLPADLQAHVASGAIGAQHARALLRLHGDEQAALARQILDGLSARDAEHAARATQNPDKTPAPKPIRLVDVAGAITAILGARTTVTDRRITITLDNPTDLQRILAQLGITTTTTTEGAAA